MSNGKEQGNNKKAWGIVGIIVVVGIIGLSIQNSYYSRQSADRAKGYAAEQVSRKGVATAEEVAQALSDLDTYALIYKQNYTNMKTTKDGMAYLDYVVAANEAAKKYNSITFLEYYYWPDTGLPKGYDKRLTENVK